MTSHPLSKDAVRTMFRGGDGSASSSAVVSVLQTAVVPLALQQQLVVRIVARIDEDEDVMGMEGEEEEKNKNEKKKGKKGKTKEPAPPSHRAVWVLDDTCRGRARLIGSAARDASLRLPCFARVGGYVTSEGNPGNPRPLLFLSEVDVLSPSPTTNIGSKPDVEIPMSRIPGGRVYEFLTSTVPHLSNPQLGRADCSRVSQFLEHARAVKTLQSSSFVVEDDSHASSSVGVGMSVGGGGDDDGHEDDNNNDDSPNNNTQRRRRTVFASALHEFTQSQLDRQSTTLTSHVNRHADAAEAVVAQHRHALEAALRFGGSSSSSSGCSGDPPLTVPVLCEWHGILCKDLHASAGRIRTKQVRVGPVGFRPARHVKSDLIAVCSALAALETRLKTTTTTTTPANDAATAQQQQQQHQPSIPPGLQAALFASIVFFAIVDTHAFADGNGRLARIASNFALKRFGFDIPIHLYATAAQRKEYTTATVNTRRNLYLLSRGRVEPPALWEAYQLAGAFTPLLQLFLDRMDRAVVELTRIVHDKQRAVQEEAQIQAARLFRERSAQGNCLICFDDSPNIATLCCGKAVHLNCMAEWLVAKNSCPNCRGELPALPQRILRQPVAADDDDDADESSSTTSTATSDNDHMSDDGTSSTTTESVDPDAGARAIVEAILGQDQFDPVVRMIEQASRLQAAVRAAEQAAREAADSDTTSTTTMDDDDGVGDAAVAVPAAAAAPADQDHSTMSVDDSTTDETTTSDDDDDDRNQAGAVADVDDTTSTTEEEPDDGCRNCSNKAARDCQNNLCGKCCLLVGQFQCARHSNLV